MKSLGSSSTANDVPSSSRMSFFSSWLLCVCQHAPNVILSSLSWILGFLLVFYVSGFSILPLHSFRLNVAPPNDNLSIGFTASMSRLPPRLCRKAHTSPSQSGPGPLSQISTGTGLAEPGDLLSCLQWNTDSRPLEFSIGCHLLSPSLGVQFSPRLPSSCALGFNCQSLFPYCAGN